MSDASSKEFYGKLSRKIKKEAKKIKKETGISHSRALDQACREVGFHNYRQFINIGNEHGLRENNKE